MADTCWSGCRRVKPHDGQPCWPRNYKAERDQLKQYVEELLGAASSACSRLESADTETHFGDDFEAEVRAATKALSETADRIRKELK